MSLFLCVSIISVPVGPVLVAQVPCGFSFSPGELLPGLAALRVPLEGDPGLGHGVVVGMPDMGGGAEAALVILEGVEVL